MFSVFKRSADRKNKNAPYRIKYKDAEGRWRTKVGCTDKQMTEQMGRKLADEAKLQRAGLHDPQEARRRSQRTRPLAEHLEDYHRSILAKNQMTKGDGSKHANSTRTYIRWIVNAIKAERIDDLTSSGVQEAIAQLLTDGKSPRTCNAYLRAIKGFSRWLWRDGRLGIDVLAPLVGYNEATDPRRNRRAFNREELDGIIRAAEAGPVILGIAGPDRAMLYRVTVGTGFRAGELRSLTPESFELGGQPPRVTVEAAYSKNRKTSHQPIRPDLAAALRPWLDGKATGQPVFAVPEKTAKMLRRDLDTAGVAYKDEAGRVGDFHALRHTFITMVVQGGASVKVAQELARHSTPMLTIGRYAHASLGDQAAALSALPEIGVKPAGPTGRATSR